MAHDSIDIPRYARLYAQRVLRNTNLDPGDMPELARNTEFKARAVREKADVTRTIRREAGQLLVASGLPADTVRKALRLEHWWQPEQRGAKHKEKAR